MTSKKPEPTDYPKWLSEILFDPKEMIKRKYFGTPERNTKALYRLMQSGRADDNAKLLFDTCVEVEMLRIDNITLKSSIRKMTEEIIRIKSELATARNAIESLMLLTEPLKKKLEKKTRKQNTKVKGK